MSVRRSASGAGRSPSAQPAQDEGVDGVARPGAAGGVGKLRHLGTAAGAERPVGLAGRRRGDGDQEKGEQQQGRRPAQHGPPGTEQGRVGVGKGDCKSSAPEDQSAER